MGISNFGNYCFHELSNFGVFVFFWEFQTLGNLKFWRFQNLRNLQSLEFRKFGSFEITGILQFVESRFFRWDFQMSLISGNSGNFVFRRGTLSWISPTISSPVFVSISLTPTWIKKVKMESASLLLGVYPPPHGFVQRPELLEFDKLCVRIHAEYHFKVLFFFGGDVCFGSFLELR